MTLKPLDIDIATTDSFMTSSDGRFVNFNLESLGIRFWRFNGGNTVYLSEFTTSLLIKNVRQEADAAPTRIHAPAGFVAMRHLDNIDIVDLKLNRTYPQHAVPVPDAVNSMTDVGIYRRSDGELRGYYHNGKVLTTFALSQMSLPFQVDVYVTKDNESPINLHHCSSLDAGAVYRLYTTTNLLTCESPMRAVIDNDTLNERSILNQLHLWCIECRPTFETDTLNVVSPQDSEMISIGISKPIIVHPLTLPITLSFVGILVITAAIENLRRRKHKRFLAIENAKSQQLELIREDMHDMIGSRLVRIASLARQTKPEDADAALARIHDMTVVTVRSLRNLLSLMSETIMTDAEFFGALREYVVESCTDAALSPTVTINTIDDDRTTLDGGARHELMMIVSEMLANTLRHAQARTVSFTMHSDAEGTTLNWQDDGVGIAPSSQRGNGLNNIQRRAARLDATVNLISHPGGGTQYTVTIPIQAS
jgi:signal transduction histidine kinase